MTTALKAAAEKNSLDFFGGSMTTPSQVLQNKEMNLSEQQRRTGLEIHTPW